MEIWAILAPLVKVLLYVLSFLAVGTGLFILHFRSFLSQPTLAYCCKLVRKSSLIGSITAPLLLLMTAGNIGGDLQSAFDPLIINIALSSKAGQSVLVLFFWVLICIIMDISFSKSKTYPRDIRLCSHTFIILIIWALHNKWIWLSATDRLTLGCYFFWVGSFLPLRYSNSGKNRRRKPVSNSTSIWRLCCLLHRGLANNWINAGNNFSWWYRAAGDF